jgi:hypothetical protein
VAKASDEDAAFTTGLRAALTAADVPDANADVILDMLVRNTAAPLVQGEDVPSEVSDPCSATICMRAARQSG